MSSAYQWDVEESGSVPRSAGSHAAPERLPPALLPAPFAPARDLAEAIRWTILYSDIFDYPLTRDELWRYLVAPGGSRVEMEIVLDRLLTEGVWLESDGRFLFRRGRQRMVARRRSGELRARRQRARAERYARWLWALPYVRMVALTGTLALSCAEPGDDIDYLIVATPGRLWTARALVLLVGRITRLFGDTICPNYIVSTLALDLGGDDLYAARELTQMIPLHGATVAARLWRVNGWSQCVLPHAQGELPPDGADTLPRGLAVLKHLGEAILSLPWGDRLERWEQRRKVRTLSTSMPEEQTEAAFSGDVCKGHALNHRARVMWAWRARVAGHDPLPFRVRGEWRLGAAGGQ